MKQNSLPMLAFENVSLFKQPYGFVLNEASFTVESGFSWVYAPDMAVVNMFIELVARLETPDKGKINYTFINNKSMHVFYHYVGLSLRRVPLFDELTVWENIKLPFLLREDSEAKAITRAKALIEWLQIIEIDTATALKHLTPFARAKIKLARALMNAPALLLIEGLFQDVTYKEMELLLKRLNELAQTGMIILFGYHDKHFIEAQKQNIIHLPITHETK